MFLNFFIFIYLITEEEKGQIRNKKSKRQI